MQQYIYIPAAPFFKQQLEISAQLCKKLEGHGYETGLMLVPLGGIERLQNDSKNIFRNISALEKYNFQSCILMLWPRPCEDTDLLNKPKKVLEHINLGVNILENLPFEKKFLTFHLGSLISQEEFLSKNEEKWRAVFRTQIVPILKEINKISAQRNVVALVETTSVPEFRNIKINENEFYGKNSLASLRNPFYLTSHWGINEIKKTGIGVCVDISHNRTIYELAKRNEEDSYGILFKEDLPYLQKLNIIDDIFLLDNNDLIHLSDGSGVYSKDGGTYSEGEALGKGEIRNLPEIIKRIHNKRVPFVLEIEETDYTKRLNTIASIEYLQKVMNS